MNQKLPKLSKFLKSYRVEQGMQVLQQDGFDKVRAGLTSIEEVARVTGTVPPAD